MKVKDLKTLYSHRHSPYTHVAFCAVMFLLITGAPAAGQELVQVKTLDEQLKPLANIEISINGNTYFAMGSKGIAFIELAERDLPVKSIAIKNESLEAASWNHSKGILEIIVRKKSYQVIKLVVTDPESKPLRNLPVIFNGRKTLKATTDDQGAIEIMLAADEKIAGAGQFQIVGHVINRAQGSGKGYLLVVEPVPAEPVALAPPVSENLQKKASGAGYFQDFDLSKIDSIESLTAFYAIFKNYAVSDMTEDVKRRLDAKLNELVRQLQDSVSLGSAFVGKISDSSFVSDDVRSLLEQAIRENAILEEQRVDFDEKIRIVNEKLAAGGQDLDEQTRDRLLSDLARLEQMLQENENKFYRNQNHYRSILNSIKEKFFHIQVLENKLTVIEAQRLEEQRVFRQRLFTILSIALLFAVLIVLLVYFSNKLRRRKRQLEIANGEVKRINENLENLVSERTRLLQESNRELDLFLYKASHDLRSPVTSIIGLCNIASQIASAESRELFDKAGQTAAGMDRMLQKLRIISEVNQPGNPSTVALLPMVQEIQNRFKAFIEHHGIDIKVSCPKDLTVYSNATLTEAIIFNLLENAVFYSVLNAAGSPKVEFSATLVDGQLQLSIYDNGPGIGDDIRPHIFNMFFIGHERSKGNGLGLYIVDKSVQALKGNITLDTESGAYCRFVITLPVDHPSAAGDPGVHDRAAHGRVLEKAG